MANFLTYEDRLKIESDLKKQMTSMKIGKKLAWDLTTITKGIKDYLMEQDTCYGSYPHNTLKYRKGCKRTKVSETNDCRHPLLTICK